MNIREIDNFIVVSQFLNISKAADFIGVSQPSLSREISALEQKLGYKLFFRVSRGLRLTSEGRIYLDGFKKIKLEIQNTEMRVKELTTKNSGHFTISIHPLIAGNILAQFEHRMASFPKLDFEYNFESSREATESVISCRSDIAIAADAQNYPDLVKIKLWSEHIALYSNDGEEKTNMLYNPNMLYAEKILSKYNKNTFRKVGDYNIIGSILKENNFMGLMPSSLAERNKNLKLIKKFKPSIDIFLVYRADRLRTKGFNELIKAFKNK